MAPILWYCTRNFKTLTFAKEENQNIDTRRMMLRVDCHSFCRIIDSKMGLHAVLRQPPTLARIALQILIRKDFAAFVAWFFRAARFGAFLLSCTIRIFVLSPKPQKEQGADQPPTFADFRKQMVIGWCKRCGRRTHVDQTCRGNLRNLLYHIPPIGWQPTGPTNFTEPAAPVFACGIGSCPD
jgi:hypothetical protein